MSQYLFLVPVAMVDMLIAWAISWLNWPLSRLLTVVVRLVLTFGFALVVLRVTGGPLDNDLGGIAVVVAVYFVVIPAVALSIWVDWLRRRARKAQVYGVIGATGATFVALAALATSFGLNEPRGV
jgi:hypothetical protein